jgi:DNA gyrase/topoisomerase IV subunit B
MICEGKSAKGALVKARNSDTTACFDLRGKLINTLKNDADKVSNNEEIRQLHIALGCGLGNKFNINKLRYGKIVIMADMDKDGYDIACLVLTFFYTMYPQLLRAGKVYWGVTPLFKVVTKNKTYFAYDEEELKKLPKGDVTRLKGLGESQPSDFRETIFSPDARMVQMTMNDGAEAAKYFDILLGTNIEERRKYIFANADFENLED